MMGREEISNAKYYIYSLFADFRIAEPNRSGPYIGDLNECPLHGKSPITTAEVVMY